MPKTLFLIITLSLSLSALAQREPRKKKEQTVDSQEILERRTSNCVWSTDLPRRIVHGPGCDKDGTKLCVGYVVCDNNLGEGKVVRMSTCSASKCGAEDAEACTKEVGYGSEKATTGRRSGGVSERAKEVLTKARGE